MVVSPSVPSVSHCGVLVEELIHSQHNIDDKGERFLPLREQSLTFKVFFQCMPVNIQFVMFPVTFPFSYFNKIQTSSAP